jgi:ABC-type nitrate/sulfonate/bicarbonate transport system ATPase subunit
MSQTSNPITPSVLAPLAPAEVALTQVSKSFGKGTDRVDVLNQINLVAAPGEILAILGPSGCGKSTLLRLVAGLEAPTSGTVMLNNIPVVGVDARCSVVFQEPRLLPWRNVSGNVRLGVRNSQSTNEIQSWLELVGLGDFSSYLPKQISGGMAQRAALARALIGHPGVLLLDEPFAALDALTRMQMQDLMVKVTAQIGTTVLLVTHDVDEALYLADRIVVLGERGQGIIKTIKVDSPRPRDRSDSTFIPLRRELLALFGVHV